MSHKKQNGLALRQQPQALTRSEPNQNKAAPILPGQLLFMIVRHEDGCRTLKTGNGGHCTCNGDPAFVSEAEFLAIVDGEQP